MNDFSLFFGSTVISAETTTGEVEGFTLRGTATLWFECTAISTPGDVSIVVELYNKATKTWGQYVDGSAVATLVSSDVTVKSFFVTLSGETWGVGDKARFKITPASGSFTTEVYIAIQ